MLTVRSSFLSTWTPDRIGLSLEGKKGEATPVSATGQNLKWRLGWESYWSIQFRKSKLENIRLSGLFLQAWPRVVPCL